VDEKTSTALGAQWSRNWDLDSQFTGYCWGARHYGLPVVGALIRGISILKTKYDNADCIIYRPEWQINRWYDQLLLDVQDMLDIYHEVRKPRLALDKGTCNNYGGCAYSRLCGSEHPANWLDPYFSINTWDPLRREKQVEV